MKNTSDLPVIINALGGIKVAPGAVVEIPDAYAHRRAPHHAGSFTGTTIPSVVEDLTNGALVPDGPEAELSYKTRLAHDLPHVVEAFKELKRVAEAERGDA
ncbi:MAG TPA: hypothetical protein VEB66_18020 [Opitutaceae bacterium]|nr:hypothetical protein [Opitutaceae bacterium]